MRLRLRALRNPARFALGAIALAALPRCSCSDDTTTNPAGPYDAIGVAGQTKITGLHGPVDVVRDKFGMIHIYAQSPEDALRVEGYQVAKDRTAQLELVRRSATGRLAELLGDSIPSLIDSDIAMRTVGLARAAQGMYDAATDEQKLWLNAYADGITQFNARLQSGDEDLPAGMIGISKTAFVAWTPIDVLAVARFQAFNLGYQADEEIARSAFVEAARSKLKSDATDPALAKRSGFLVDMLRIAPLVPATPLDGFPNDTTNTMSGHIDPSKVGGPVAGAKAVSFRASPSALDATRGFRDALYQVRSIWGEHPFTGSNDWVVAPSRSATGHAMLANDPHLTLSAPAVFWMVQITTPQTSADPAMSYAGLAFPGLPGIILGFNKDVAWGATTADYDVTDVYQETLTGDASGVVFNGQNVPFQKVHETIGIAGKPSLEYEVLVVPHHGPVVPNITAAHTVAAPSGASALSVKWTGHPATKDVDTIFGLVRAKNVDDTRTALESFSVGAQNWVAADTSGNIFYSTHSLIPKRDKRAFTWDPATFTGTIPCLVLPGDGTAEWTGSFLEDAFIPHVKNPQKGYLATANTDQVGDTLDNDPTNDLLPTGEPMYMACAHDPGFRLGRIADRIENAGHPLSIDDLASIQADARSAAGSKLAPLLIAALQSPPADVAASDRWKAADIAGAIDALTRWGSESDYDAASGMNPDDNTPVTDDKEATASRATAIFNAWITRMAHATFDDEIRVIGTNAVDYRNALVYLMTADKTALKTYDATADDSILFDDLSTASTTETRAGLACTSMLDALDFLKTRLGDDPAGWRWGKLHTIRFTALVSLWKTLSIPNDPDPVFPLGFPRHGDGDNVDVGGYPMPAALDGDASFSYGHGPTQRFVIDMDPAGPVAKNALPGGNVWDGRDPHFADEAERWRRNQNRPVPFAASDVIANAESRTVYSSP